MARVTIEDCLDNERIENRNRFSLVLTAAGRAHDLQLSGASGKHKPAVTALKEIAEGYTEVAKPLHEDLLADSVEMQGSTFEISAELFSQAFELAESESLEKDIED